MHVFVRFGYTDERGDVKWGVKQDWDGVPYPAIVAMQKIMHAAEGEMLKLGEQALVQKKAEAGKG